MNPEIMNVIASLAREGGELARRRRQEMSRDAVHFKGGNPADLVTDVDREVEGFITSELHRVFPEYAVFGEENGVSGTGDGCFVIDPIDGTTSFVHDLPHYCVSIGFQLRGESVAGAVYAPKLDELFTAEAGRGAFLNGKKIRVSDCAVREAALFATGFGCVRAGLRPDNFDFIPDIVRGSQGFRCGGSAALDLCHTASGEFDAYWELLLQPYDVAAGTVILREAGGRITDLEGGGDFPARGVLAGNAGMHDILLPFFRRLRP